MSGSFLRLATVLLAVYSASIAGADAQSIGVTPGNLPAKFNTMAAATGVNATMGAGDCKRRGRMACQFLIGGLYEVHGAAPEGSSEFERFYISAVSAKTFDRSTFLILVETLMAAMRPGTTAEERRTTVEKMVSKLRSNKLHSMTVWHGLALHVDAISTGLTFAFDTPSK